MRVQVAPGIWQELGPVKVVARLKATGYTIPNSPLPTIESDEAAQEAKVNQVGKRVNDGRQYRKIKAVVK